MPTESEFLEAASFFDSAASGIAVVPGNVSKAFGAEVAVGGQLTLDIESLLTDTTAGCTSDDTALAALAALCRERAAIVATYREALGIFYGQQQSYDWAISRWERNRSDFMNDPHRYSNPGLRPTAPVRPNRPESWVEL